MRFRSLDLLAYGPFTGVSLDLDASSGMDIVFGRNEAGKSTTLRAIRGVLFGIDERTRDTHLHRPGELRVGARVVSRDGRELAVVRRKGRKRTLLDPEGGEVPEERLRAFFPGVTGDIFGAMFGLDQAGLRAGAKALLEGKGSADESIFESALGGRGLSATLAILRAEAEALYAPQATTRPLNVALRAIEEHRERVVSLAFDPEAWERMETSLADDERRAAELDEALRHVQGELVRQRRIQRALPRLASRLALLSERASLGTIPAMASSAARDRERAMAARDEARSRATRLLSELPELEREHQAREQRASLALTESALRGLSDDLGSHRKAALDRPRRVEELARLTEETRSILLDLGREAGLTDIEPLRIDALKEARLRQLARTRAVLRELVSVANAQVRDEETAVATAVLAASALPPPRDTSGIERVLSRSRVSADLDAQASAAGSAARRLAARAADALTALGFKHDPSALRSLAVPSGETVDTHARALEALDASRHRLAEQMRRTTTQRLEAERDLGALTEGRDLPSEASLGVARSRRDALVVRMGEGAHEGGAPAADVVSELRRDILTTDEIADRLRWEATRVAEARELEVRVRHATLEEARLSEEIDRLSLAERSATSAWGALWGALGVEPRAPSEMRSWLLAHAAALAALDDAEREGERAALLRSARDEILSELTAALALVGASRPPTFAAGIALAEEERGRRSAELLHRREIEGELAASRARLSRRTTDKASRDAALDEHERAWAEETRGLARRDDLSTVELEVLLDRTRALFERVDAANKLRRRIGGIDRDALALSARVALLVGEHAPDLVGRETEAAADELLRRYHGAREARAERSSLERDIEQRRKELKELDHSLREATDTLASLLVAAGVETEGELIVMEERAARVRDLSTEIRALEHAIVEHGDGRDLEALVTEAAGVAPDAHAVAIEDLEARVEALAEDRKALAESIGSQKHGLQRGASASGQASTPAEDTALAIAAAGEILDRFIRAKVSVSLLEREVERYRQRHQGPVVTRASALFQQLTLQTFTRLSVGFGEGDEPTLLASRASGPALAVHALSDGTRDALYLALRVATLERHATFTEPLPLVLDDVLLHFDDDRARAALLVLAELGTTLQVLFFTHHARLVDIAREALPPERCRIHTLRE